MTRKRRKKKQGIVLPLSVILDIVIGLIIFFFVISFASDLVKLGLASKSTYNLLVQRIDELSKKDEAVTSVALNLNKGSALLIFPAGVEEVDEIVSSRKHIDVYTFKRAESCSNETSCICLCSKTEKKKKYTPLNLRNVLYLVLPTASLETVSLHECVKEPRCKSFEGASFVFKGENANQSKGRAFVKKDKNTKLGVLKIQKYKNVYAFCKELPCIDDELRGKIDYGNDWEAVKEISSQVELIKTSCSEYPHEISISVPPGYAILTAKNLALVNKTTKDVIIQLGLSYCQIPLTSSYVDGVLMLESEKKNGKCCLKETLR